MIDRQKGPLVGWLGLAWLGLLGWRLLCLWILKLSLSPDLVAVVEGIDTENPAMVSP